MMGTPFGPMALFNRAVLLTAFDAFEAGDLPSEAWGAYRVAVTRRHEALRKAFRSSEPAAAVGEATSLAKLLPSRTQRAIQPK